MPKKAKDSKGMGAVDTTSPEGLGLVHALADLFGSYIDQPNDPQAQGSMNDEGFHSAFQKLLPSEKYGYTPSDFGILQMNPQYRGLRMILPQSGGSYGEATQYDGAQLYNQGYPRMMGMGPVGQPDPTDPHNNGIPRYPANQPTGGLGLQQAVYGEMINRGYPVYGGSGDLPGFQTGFNPIGFGQR